MGFFHVGNEWAHPDRKDGRCRPCGGKGRRCALWDDVEQWGGEKDGELHLALGTERLPRAARAVAETG